MSDSEQNEMLAMIKQARHDRAAAGNQMIKGMITIIENGSFSRSSKQKGTQLFRQEDRNNNNRTEKKWWSSCFPCSKMHFDKEDAYESNGCDLKTPFTQENRQPFEECFERLSNDLNEDETEENIRKYLKDKRDSMDDLLFRCSQLDTIVEHYFKS